MSLKELQCPTCDGDMLLAGDERQGDQVFCPTCSAPSKLRTDDETDELELVADY